MADARPRVLAAAALLCWSLAGPGPASGQESEAAEYRAVVDRYCVACHNARSVAGGLSLAELDFDLDGAGAEVWEKVLHKLQTRAMPPARRPRPEEAVYARFADWLESGLDAAAAAEPNPGRPTLHRLNRQEYANAIRDLFGVGIDVEALLPADDMAFGFDNNADILTVSPGLLERYMSAARRVARLAVEAREIERDVVLYEVSHLAHQDRRMSEDLPFGSRGGTAVRHHFPRDGEYRLRVTLAGRPREPQLVDVRLDGARVAAVPVGDWPDGTSPPATGGALEDGAVVVRLPVTAGSHLVGASFLRRARANEGVAPERLPLWTFSTGSVPLALETLAVEGPFQPDALPAVAGETASPRARLFRCRPTTEADEAACADEILGGLARRALRRPVSEDDLGALRLFFSEGRQRGGFDAGIQRALELLLVDPEFLFRMERDPGGLEPGSPYQLSDLELASRLSFFLWSSVPDDELLDVAEAGRLADPLELEAQVRRMLADERAATLVTSFASQWLQLRRMESVAPDVNAFPEFDETLREAMVRETELLFADQLRADRSVVDLLTADYSFLNERLARHYGISGVYGSRFRRVAFDDERRRGILGQGSVLTVTSHATRTSPVVRGKWVLENILGAPPPAPPPDVPPLPERDDTDEPASMRARMEAHRANPVCSACHAQMDPLGFALEQFDAVGKFREQEGGVPVDPSGTMPDGAQFDGLPEMRAILFERRDEFVATVAEKLLTYALGRGVDYYDRPALRAIVRDAEADDYRWSSLIVAIARSLPFQMRSTES